MKKQYLFMLGLAMAGLTANAQNLVENGGFEDWTGANPVNFSASTFGTPPQLVNDLLVKETTQTHGGLNSCRQTSKAQGTTQYLEYGELINVDPTHSYTFSYWFLDNDNKASTRPWSTWLPDSGSIAAPLQSLQQQDYSTNNAQWVLKTITATPPTAATKVRIQIRTYHQDGNSGGFIYFDDVSFVDNTTNGINENAIAAVKMFPNPLNGDVLTILTESDAPKTVTIFDVLGKQVVSAVTSNNTVNVANLTSGVYMVKISQEGKTATKKLVVQ